MKLIFITTLLATSFALAQGQGQTQKPTPAQRGSDKVDLKKLEEKYWSAKDEDYAVIQNRTFSKEGKFYFNANGVSLMNDPFANSKGFGAYVGYHFTEDFGIEINYTKYSPSKNDSVTGFESNSANVTIRPNFNMLEQTMTAALTYTPFYAKMAFMNRAILYFDMGFSLGFGTSKYRQMYQDADMILGTGYGEKYDTKTTPHVEIGVMQQLFINKNIAFRLDIKNSFYNEKVIQYAAPIGAVHQEVDSKTKNDTSISLGITLFTN